MLRRWGKRGLEDKIPFTIWEIIVILMVVIALTVSVRGIANNTTYWKKYHSADLALMTDLILTNQGDFNINYNLKEVQTNRVTKIMRIEPLVFQIFLRDEAFFIYDKSIDEDRFPQSYIYARDPSNIKIILSNTTNDYLILRKLGTILSINDYFTLLADTSCPSENTKQDTSLKHFEVVSLSDSTSSNYGTFLNNALRRYTGTEEEMLIFLIEDSAQQTTIYYDTSNVNPVRSQKMSCLIKKQVIQKYPDLNIIEKPYDNSLDTNSVFANNKNLANQYGYWIVIKVKQGDVTSTDLTESIINAIEEYYN